MDKIANTDSQRKRGDAWYKRYPRDIYEATRALSLEARGAYNDVLDLMYIHGGPIPDDDKWMSHALHVSTRKWASLKAALIAAQKITVQDGLIHNARADFELESRANQSRTNAESATNRERTKREKSKNENKNNETDARNEHHVYARQNQIQNIDREVKDTPLSSPLAKSKADSKRGSRLPADWALPAEWRSWAQINFAPDDAVITLEAERFRDFWIAKPGQAGCKLDWQATWRNWCRNAKVPATRVQRPPSEAWQERRAHNASVIYNLAMGGANA